MQLPKKEVKYKRGNKNLLFLIILISTLFLLSISYINASDYVSNSNFPTITLEFGESVSLISAHVCCEDETQNFCNNDCDSSDPDIFANYSDGSISVTENGRIIIYRINNNFLNGNYRLLTTISDLLGNSAEFEISFLVNYSTMPITLLKPYEGCSNSSSFDLVIETEEEANCWYNYNHDFNFDPNNFLLSPLYWMNFHSADKLIHTKTNFTDDHNFPSNKGVSVYVTCNKSFDRSMHFKHFNLMWDDSLPIINYSFIDGENILIDDKNQKYYTLWAQSLGGVGDKIGCEIQTLIDDNQPVYNPQFTELDSSVNNPLNISNPWSYKTFNSRTIEYEDINDFNIPHNYLYNISCRNRAQLFDDPKLLNITVKLNNDFTITKIKPDNFVTNPVEFIFRTSVSTRQCTKTVADPLLNLTSITLFDLGQIKYVYSFSGLNYNDGEYTENITCESDLTSKSLTYTFKVDSINPENLTVDIKPNTCSLSKIEFSAEADDSYSGIAYFNYTLLNSASEIIVQDIVDADDADDIEIDYDLTENETYTIKVWAYDGAGNSVGPQTATIKATTADILACDNTKPDVILTKIQEVGITYLNITCSDDSGCEDIYHYDLLTNITQDCNYSSQKAFSDSFTYVIDQKTKVCVKAHDNNLNERLVSEIIDVQYGDHCENQVQDGTETDVDCGGVDCPGCLINDSCVDDPDCVSGWCNDLGVCDDASCEDGVVNGFETDIDCGGVDCPGCLINDSCVDDPDCVSGWCNDLGVCDDASCEDGVVNGFETDIDCGGVDCPGCANGQQCNEDSDCNSGSCDLLYGECEGEINLDDDTDEDGMPDNWEDLYNLDKYDPSDADEDNDGDGSTNLQEYYAGTNPNIPDGIIKSKTNIISLVLLILGILLFLGGVGYLIYYSKTQKTLSPKSNQSLATQAAQVSQKPKLSKEQLEKLKKRREIMLERFRKKSEKNKSKISAQLSPFEQFDDKIEKSEIEDVKKKLVKGIKGSIEKEKNYESKKEKKEPKKLDENIHKDFVDLDELSTDKKSSKKESDSDKDKAESLFEKLEEIDKIKNKLKPINKTNKQEKSEDSEDSVSTTNKTFATEDDFKQLDKLIEQQLKRSKEQEEKDTNQDEQVNDNNEIKNKEQVKDKDELKQQGRDVFAELQKIADKKSKKSLIKKSPTNINPLESEDLVKMFKDKEVDINVFKVILSELLNSKKLNNTDVSNIIFKLLEQDLIKKDVANQILVDLSLINKNDK